MFVKKTTGCAGEIFIMRTLCEYTSQYSNAQYEEGVTFIVARSNITEEYGMDPCIDEMAPASFGDYRGDACTPEQHAKQFIMR